MELFITIFAVIWFVFFSAILLSKLAYAKKPETIKIHWWLVISLFASFSWIIKMVVQWAS